jgi:hypothetical protein
LITAPILIPRSYGQLAEQPVQQPSEKIEITSSEIVSKHVDVVSIPCDLELDLGTVPTSIPSLFVVELRNKTGSKINCSSVASSCGCLVSRDFPTEIETGDIGKFKLAVTPSKDGKFHKRLIVNSENSDQTISINVMAEGKKLFEVLPAFVEIDEQGGATDVICKLNFADSYSFKGAKLVTHVTNYVDVELKIEEQDQIVLAVKHHLGDQRVKSRRFSEILELCLENGKRLQVVLPCTAGTGIEFRPDVIEVPTDKPTLDTRAFITGKPSDVEKVNLADLILRLDSGVEVQDVTLREVRRSSSLVVFDIHLKVANIFDQEGGKLQKLRVGFKKGSPLEKQEISVSVIPK